MRAARRAARAAARRARSSERYGETRGVPGLPDGIPIARHRRRSAGGAVRPGLLRRRRRQVHLRHRRVHPDEHRQPRRAVASTACSPPSRWKLRRRGRLRARGLDVHRRRHGAVAARRARHHHAARARSRRSRASVPDSGGVVVGAGARRARRAALAARRARHHHRPDARHDQGAPRARDARGHRAADRRPPGRDGGATPASPLGTLKVDGGASANDLLMQFQADVLGVRDRAAGAGRDDRARRRVARRPRRRRLEGHR